MRLRTRDLAVDVLDLPLPVPEDARDRYRTATCVLDDRFLVTSWVEGRESVRIGVLDLRDGSWRVGKGVRGMLAAALALPGSRALLLCDYGLFEFDLQAMKVTRRLSAKIGKYNDLLRFDDDDHALVVVGNRRATMESLVSLEAFDVVRRRKRRTGEVEPVAEAVARAGVERVLHRDDGVLLGATSSHPGDRQQLVVIDEASAEVMTSVEFPCGLASAHPVHDGIVAAAPHLGRGGGLTEITGLFDDPDPAHDGPTLAQLAARASDSAAAILERRRRRIPPRTVVRGIRLDPGGELADVSAQRITLVDCSVARASTAEERPRIARVHVTDLELSPASVNGAVLEDVVIDGIASTVNSSFVFGCELRRVTLRGRIEHLILNATISDLDPETNRRYAAWHRARLDDPEWMLDLREATGDITIRGYPSRFIRRNPELHVVVTAESAAGSDWESIDAGRSALVVGLDELIQYGWEDVTLIVDPHGRRADADFRYVRELRARGIAQAD
ncbi:hypothetical protein [Agromyces sp. NPDC058126]|uniref:hypothetical protein n=1 Tax=Agromyces sp. NPDC058126 TaxID=3346350 RepID=UPI0036DC2BFA